MIRFGYYVFDKTDIWEKITSTELSQSSLSQMAWINESTEVLCHRDSMQLFLDAVDHDGEEIEICIFIRKDGAMSIDLYFEDQRCVRTCRGSIFETEEEIFQKSLLDPKGYFLSFEDKSYILEQLKSTVQKYNKFYNTDWSFNETN